MKFFKIRKVATAYCNALLAVYLAGCCSTTNLSGNKSIGHLRVIGDQIKVNNRPAVDGQTILRDDVVTSGAKSSAVIECISCGVIQLDENTD